MRKLLGLLTGVLLVLLPLQAFAAVAFDTSATGASSGSNVTSASVNATLGGTATVVFCAIATRDAGAASPGVMTATWNGVSMTRIVTNDANLDSVTFTNLFYLLNPATGTHACALSWANGARYAEVVYSFSGAGSVGTPVIVESNSSNPFTASATITTGDLVFGTFALAASSALTTVNNNNPTLVAESTNWVEIGANNNSGSGSVTVSAQYTVAPQSTSIATPVIQTATPAAPLKNGTVTLFGEW